MSRRCCFIADFNDNVVSLLSPWQQLRDYVAIKTRAQQQRRDGVAAYRVITPGSSVTRQFSLARTAAGPVPANVNRLTRPDDVATRRTSAIPRLGSRWQAGAASVVIITLYGPEPLSVIIPGPPCLPVPGGLTNGPPAIASSWVPLTPSTPGVTVG